jgi:hypothetical protein
MITPQQLSWSLIFSSTSSGSATNIEATIDNPFVYGDATRGQQGGLVNNPSSQAPLVIPLLSAASSNQFLNTTSTFPAISAWRTNNSSNIASIAVTFLQTGAIM